MGFGPGWLVAHMVTHSGQRTSEVSASVYPAGSSLCTRGLAPTYTTVHEQAHDPRFLTLFRYVDRVETNRNPKTGQSRTDDT